mmetsp:Transcript_14746/g.30533  ORF Transcript_14746/g.30533 Transcript_14746/m.30533 type:complete len:233 (-) Transcript_14746:142-840(-)
MVSPDAAVPPVDGILVLVLVLVVGVGAAAASLRAASLAPAASRSEGVSDSARALAKRADEPALTASTAIDRAAARSQETARSRSSTPQMALVFAASQRTGRFVVFSAAAAARAPVEALALVLVPQARLLAAPVPLQRVGASSSLPRSLRPRVAADRRASQSPSRFPKTSSSRHETMAASFGTRSVDRSITSRSPPPPDEDDDRFSTTTQIVPRASHRCRKVFQRGLPLRSFR